LCEKKGVGEHQEENYLEEVDIYMTVLEETGETLLG